MKKTLIIATTAISLISSLANAKTEGNYVELNAIHTNVESSDYYSEKHKDEKVSYGVGYKYAFNFNNFFVAPGLFYNHNNTENKFTDVDGPSSATYQSRLKNSYGAKLDLGYDITDKFAAFVSVGIQENRISSRFDFPGGSAGSRNSNEKSELFGAGLKYSITDKVDLNLAYERSEYDIAYFDMIENTQSDNNAIEVVKVGVSYNF